MEKISENIAIFYNKDCQKWGVKRHCKCHEYGDHWPQIITPKGGVYTNYKKVAERWAREVIAAYGDTMNQY